MINTHLKMQEDLDMRVYIVNSGGQLHNTYVGAYMWYNHIYFAFSWLSTSLVQCTFKFHQQ